MIELTHTESVTCDICGKKVSGEAYETCNDPNRKDWVHIYVSRNVEVKPDLSKPDLDCFVYAYKGDILGHSVDLCPSCSKEIIKYLKENCDVHATWPEGL